MANLFKRVYTGTLAQYNALATKDVNALYMLHDGTTGVKSMYKGTTKVSGDFIIVNGGAPTSPETGVIYYISAFVKETGKAGKPFVGFWNGTAWVALSDSATIDSLDERITALEEATKIDGHATAGSIGAEVHTLIGDATVTGSVKEQVATAKSEIIGDATEKGNTLGELEDRIESLEADDLKVAKLTDAEIASLSDANVKEAYKLINGDERKAIGEVIKVYKDSSVYGVKLTDENIQANDESSTDKYDNADASNDPQYLSICYQKATGKYDMVSIDLKKFLTDSEFTNGLIVTNGKVAINLGTSNTYLKFGSETEGDKTLQANITYLKDAQAAKGETPAVTGLADALDVKTYVDSKATDLAVTAEGDTYVSATVDANKDNKHVVVAATQTTQDSLALADSAVQSVDVAAQGQEVTVSTTYSTKGTKEVKVGVTKSEYTIASILDNGTITFAGALSAGLIDATTLSAFVRDEIAKNGVYWDVLPSQE